MRCLGIDFFGDDITVGMGEIRLVAFCWSKGLAEVEDYFGGGVVSVSVVVLLLAVSVEIGEEEDSTIRFKVAGIFEYFCGNTEL